MWSSGHMTGENIVTQSCDECAVTGTRFLVRLVHCRLVCCRSVLAVSQLETRDPLWRVSWSLRCTPQGVSSVCAFSPSSFSQPFLCSSFCFISLSLSLPQHSRGPLSQVPRVPRISNGLRTGRVCERLSNRQQSSMWAVRHLPV